MPEADNAEEVRIRALLEDWADAVRRHDLPAILAHHEQDVLMFDLPPPLQCKGIEAYAQTWDLFFRYHKPGTAPSQRRQQYPDRHALFCSADPTVVEHGMLGRPDIGRSGYHRGRRRISGEALTGLAPADGEMPTSRAGSPGAQRVPYPGPERVYQRVDLTVVEALDDAHAS